MSTGTGNDWTAKPMGVTCCEDYIILRAHVKSRIGEKLAVNKELVINIVRDPLLILKALKDELEPEPAVKVKAWRVKGCAGYIEAVVEEEASGEEYKIFRCKPVHVEGSGPGLSRAEQLLLEAAVHATRIKPLLAEGRPIEALMLAQWIGYARLVAWRVSGPKAARIYDEILRLGL